MTKPIRSYAEIAQNGSADEVQKAESRALGSEVEALDCMHCHQSFMPWNGHVSEDIALCYSCLDRN